MLAHNATIYGIPFDPEALYDAEPLFMDWFGGVVDEVGATREKQRAEAEAQANARS